MEQRAAIFKYEGEKWGKVESDILETTCLRGLREFLEEEAAPGGEMLRDKILSGE